MYKVVRKLCMVFLSCPCLVKLQQSGVMSALAFSALSVMCMLEWEKNKFPSILTSNGMGKHLVAYLLQR